MSPHTNPSRVIRSQVVLEEHDVAPHGRFAVVVRRSVAGKEYRSHLWLIPLEGKDKGTGSGKGKPTRLTTGAVRDSYPRIAPDGRSIAFRRATPMGEGRVMVLALRSDGTPGKLRALNTPAKRAVSALAWSPDSKRLALAMEEDRLRFIVGGEPPKDEEPLARRITRIDWRYDEAGHMDRRTQLFVTGIGPRAKPRQLTSADWDVTGLAWSPDGARIAFAADPRADSDLRPRRSVWAVGVDAAHNANAADATPQPAEVLAAGGDVYAPAWSPDGRWIAAIGWTDAEALDDQSPTLLVGPADGSAAPWPLAPTLDRPLGAWLDSDLHGWMASQRSTPSWADERTIIATVSADGRSMPWRFGVDPLTGRGTGDPEPLTEGEIAAFSLAVATAAAGTRNPVVTFLATIGSGPVELATVPVSGGQPTVRSSLGSRWARNLAWPTMRHVQVPGPGGPIDTWIASPAGARDDEALPTVVDVHGGPLGAWAPAPSIEVVLLCARGYRVVLPNIRGSATYGQAWITPQLGDWGGVDAADVHAALDHAIALGLADPARLGALGLSYGGFMVNWLVGTSDRLRAAVSENGVSNQVSDWANSDTGVEYNRMSLLGNPLDRGGMEKLWRQSPMSNVAQIHTPLLMLQAEADRRCPAADNEQLFIALRVLGRPVEFVLYPEEFHVYQASGRPDRRIDRMTRMLDWFDRYLKA